MPGIGDAPGVATNLLAGLGNGNAAPCRRWRWRAGRRFPGCYPGQDRGTQSGPRTDIDEMRLADNGAKAVTRSAGTRIAIFET